jgi:hypothetical protein
LTSSSLAFNFLFNSGTHRLDPHLFSACFGL